MRFPPPLRIGIPLVLFLFGLFAGVISYFFEQREQQRSVETLATERMEFLGPKLAGMTAFLLEKNLPEGAQREISLTGTSPGLRHALVFDAQDVVQFATRREQRGLGIKDSLGSGQVEIVQRARRLSGAQIQVAVDGGSLVGAFPFQMAAAGETKPGGVGVVLLDFDLSRQKAEMRAADIRRLQVVVVVLLALTLIFSLIFHRMLTARVNRIVDVSRQLAGGKLDARAGLSGGDELLAACG